MRPTFALARPWLIAGLVVAASSATAQSTPTPSLEEQVLAGINAARTDPAAYLASLQRYRGYFENDIVHLPGRDVGLRTREGVAAVDEAIAFLARQKPLAPLEARPELADAARELVEAQAVVGGSGHAGSGGADPRARIKKRGGGGVMAEVLSYGTSEAEAVVRQLIVDDGVPTRPNRALLFEDKYRTAGVACGPHPVNRSVCAVDMAAFVGSDPRPKKAPAKAPMQIEVH